ncbi:glycogen debranching enzyme GlgX [Nakamurella antarctica]|uniref:Glycogen debranching enzyme GlgX n=1 Tax=Nakamurella antarctica TaxID=1902245 RepID=A0A3G8ZKT1_9ACTN|nr:glycogen debranching protein GlgX [Nakamurella antarctica]AZI57853.1 glycogen debranching enzyme GlgX [Nakamurella antarctica]
MLPPGRTPSAAPGIPRPRLGAASSYPGRPFPLGATLAADGTYFSVAAAKASAVELCLVNAGGAETRIELTEQTFGIWHGFIPGVGAGQRYGYRVHGIDPSKLLLDPYARRVDSVDYDLDIVSAPGVDSAGHAPLGFVTAPLISPRPGPQVPWEHTVLYEAHVKGLTQLHPGVPESLRGTYAGVAHPAIIEHLLSLNVTTLELLPVQAFSTEPGLRATGRSNYWGYSTLSYFAPHPRYASRTGAERTEFASMVDALHGAGIEVVLDVVYNHTSEGCRKYPTPLTLRGFDPDAYYLPFDSDITGTGNTLQTGSLETARLVCDSLRYWATEFQIDGFRFDLASVLGRPHGGAFDPGAALLTAIAADPLLATRKLIAEPWDATGEGYAVGQFGAMWAEWNDRFRDGVRDFWRGAGGVRDIGYRLTGSSDLYSSNRRPWASINFVTAHDGFTLRDTVSYEHKHNLANGEQGRDGTDNNRSANYGEEGESCNLEIRALRTRQARNLAATLLLSTGTPMVTMGDELWRTQGGNNNAYCHDNEISWVDWTLEPEQADMLAFFQHTLRIRADSPALHQGEFFEGRQTVFDDGLPDLVWFNTVGQQMTDEDWFDSNRQTVQMWLDGQDVRGHGPYGQPLSDDSWLIVLHAGAAPIDLTLPGPPYAEAYVPELSTDSVTGVPYDVTAIPSGVHITVPGRTFLLFRIHRAGDIEDAALAN